MEEVFAFRAGHVAKIFDKIAMAEVMAALLNDLVPYTHRLPPEFETRLLAALARWDDSKRREAVN